MRYAVLLAVLVACGPGPVGDADTAPGGLPRECTLPWPPPRPVSLERRWADVPLVEPTMLRRVPGGGWLVLQRDGTLLALDEDRTSAGSAVALDLRDRVVLLHDTGATGFALSPGFADDGQIYVVYSAAGGTTYASRLSRFRRDPEAPGLVFDRASEEILLEQEQYDPLGFHGHGDVAFGPDGMLYMGLGDGGPFGDPYGHGQDRTDLYASILRIDVTRADPGRPYAIPPDNPYADGVIGAPEIWAWGFRNPFRFAFDPATGALFAGDVGHITREEVDRVERGQNYGWPVWEGTVCQDVARCSMPGFTRPIVDYPRTLGGMITGGVVYRGQRLPDLVGRYVFVDFVTGLVVAVDADGGEPDVVGEGAGLAVALATDEDGELVVVTIRGGIYDVVPSTDTFDPDFPRTLSETGCVDPAHPTHPAPGLLPYEVNVPLWSDGAHKDRWISLPEGGSMSMAPDGKLVLPPGAVVMKRFERGGRTVETRLFARHLDGSYAGYTYAWDADQGDAVLLDTYGDFGSWSYMPAPWAYPTRGQCMQCHNEAAGSVLGLEQAQLDRDVVVDGGPVSQLEAWADAGLLVGLPDERPDPLPSLGAVEAPERARAWLHVNCSTCHRPGGPTPVEMDLRFGTPLSAMGVCDGIPQDPRGLSDARLVAPAEPDRSVLLLRIEEGSMPPIGHRLVDPVGRTAVRNWIESLDDCADPP